MEVPDHTTYTLLGPSLAPQGQHGSASQHKASFRPRGSGYVVIALGLLNVLLLSLLTIKWILCQVEKKDWNSSQHFCLSVDSKLLTLAGPKEMALLSRLLQERFYWIGLRNRSGWRWEDGSALNFSRVLHNSEVQRCGTISQESLWASSCEVALPWVCQKARS